MLFNLTRSLRLNQGACGKEIQSLECRSAVIHVLRSTKPFDVGTRAEREKNEGGHCSAAPPIREIRPCNVERSSRLQGRRSYMHAYDMGV
jgi:hypothetical protein